MTPIVRLLLVVTISAYLLQNQLPYVANRLVFFPPIVLEQPWSPITYMFLHGGWSHLFFNMLALFFFGPRVESRLDSKRFTVLYFVSGLSGAAISALFSPLSPIIGASAGVFGVMLAFAYYWPHEPVHIWGVIPVPARILVIATTALSLWSGFGNSRGGIAHFAHLGGYLGAYLYLRWISRKQDSFRKKHDATPVKDSLNIETLRKIDSSQLHPLNREELERILSKASLTGTASLTVGERQFLSNFLSDGSK